MWTWVCAVQQDYGNAYYRRLSASNEYKYFLNVYDPTFLSVLQDREKWTFYSFFSFTIFLQIEVWCFIPSNDAISKLVLKRNSSEKEKYVFTFVQRWKNILCRIPSLYATRFLQRKTHKRQWLSIYLSIYLAGLKCTYFLLNDWSIYPSILECVPV